MFDRKDAVPVLFLLLLIFAIVVTLSQILVVHHHNHHSNRHPKHNKSVQLMINQLEKTVRKIMKSNVLSQKKYENALLAQIYAARVRGMLELNQKDRLRREQQKKSGNAKQYVIDNDRKARVLQTSKYKHGNSITSDDYKVNSDTNGDRKVYDTVGVKFNFTSDSKRNSTYFDSDVIGKKRQTVGVYTLGGKYPGVHFIINRMSKRLPLATAEQSPEKPARPKDICSEFPENLVGSLEVNIDGPYKGDENPNSIEVDPGGRWRPKHCVARHRVAIVIPYRDRKVHLYTLLYHLIPVLQRQQLDFRIFVVEQSGNETFNKGRLMNAGFAEAWKISDFNCFIFHDVDLIPEDDRNMYSCPPNTPRHMSVAVDKFSYTLPYPRLVGGVFSIRREHFLKVNGYSNLYWGWGAEDDDMALRLKEVGLEISRPPPKVARYKMIKHDTRETLPSQWTYYMLRTLRKRFKKDGLNSLNYKVVSIANTRTYTHVMVNIGEAPRKRVYL